MSDSERQKFDTWMAGPFSLPCEQSGPELASHGVINAWVGPLQAQSDHLAGGTGACDK